MLPFEVFSLVLLACAASALPASGDIVTLASEASPPTPLTAAPSSTQRPDLPQVVHGESSVTGFEVQSSSSSSKGPPAPKVHTEISETGLGIATSQAQPTVLSSEIQAPGFDEPASSQNQQAPTVKPKVVVTDAPSIVGIQTQIVAPQSQGSNSNNQQSNNQESNNNQNNDGNQNSNDQNSQNSNSNSGGNNNNNNNNNDNANRAQNSPSAAGGAGGSAGGPSPAQATSGNQLLNLIVSQIGAPQPGATANNGQSSPTGTAAGKDQNQQQATGSGGQVVTAADGTPVTVMSGQASVPALSLDQSITLGAATLTLTPGLSTTVGTGSAATFIALTTNSAGQTMIVISSSGTAITATVTAVPKTVSTVPSSVEASATVSVQDGNTPASGSSGAAAKTTSKKAGAAGKSTWDTGCSLGLVVGIIGAIVIL